jgi:hypothetical protein
MSRVVVQLNDYAEIEKVLDLECEQTFSLTRYVWMINMFFYIVIINIKGVWKLQDFSPVIFVTLPKKGIEIVPHVVVQRYDYVKQKTWISSMQELL